MYDDIDQLSDKEKEKLKQFRGIVQDILKEEHDDYYLLKWLIARKFDLKKSEEMLRNHMVWRKENDVDSVLDWVPPDVFLQYFPGGHTGYDKEGRPVWVVYSNIDVKGLMLSAKKKDILKFQMRRGEQILKSCRDQAEKLGRRIDRVIVINDMSPMSLKLLYAPGMSLMKELMAQFQDNYPELVHASYIINAPKVFPIVYNIIKPWINEETRRRMNVLGADYKGKILSVIDEDQIPVNWGGTQTDPDGDPYCRSKVGLGGIIPETYYLKGQQGWGDDQYDEVQVSRSGCHYLTFEILTPGTLLSWVFMTDNHDIKFSVLFTENLEEGEQEELVPPERVMCHMVPEDGCLECTKPGMYLLKFDNTYSWVHAKKVRYITQVTHPNGAEDGEDTFHDTQE